MKSNHQAQFVKDLPNKTIAVTRNFNAPLDEVWRAWTDSEVLDKWWAPKPWRAQTKSMDFREGGHWLYAMVGPDNEKHWSRVDYIRINPKNNFDSKDCFCDEQGKQDQSMPAMEWSHQFSSSEDGTQVHIVISFETEEQLDQLVKMGFEEGFAAGMSNLDDVLASAKD
jgi:uncharacterized protein YndB with AHSA1/START domain